jgi:uncharacterized protein YxjI
MIGLGGVWIDSFSPFFRCFRPTTRGPLRPIGENIHEQDRNAPGLFEVTLLTQLSDHIIHILISTQLSKGTKKNMPCYDVQQVQQNKHTSPAYDVIGDNFSWNTPVKLLMDKFYTCNMGKEFVRLSENAFPYEETFSFYVPGGLQIKGKFANYTHNSYDYNFICRETGTVVAKVDKKFSRGNNNSYQVVVADNQDDVAILCACIIVDCSIQNKNAANRAAAEYEDDEHRRQKLRRKSSVRFLLDTPLKG